MKRGRNNWFAYINDCDLNTNESYQSRILNCPACGALFKTKACGGRSIFPWFGYHPTDGNVRVITQPLKEAIESLCNECNCPDRLNHVNSVDKLNAAIDRINRKEAM